MGTSYWINPYSNQTFMGFFLELCSRIWQGLQGKITTEQVATDEIQLLVLAGVAVSSALIGTFLVLRKMTMVANSLSHTILVGIVLAFVWTYGFHGAEQSHGEPIDLHVLTVAALIMGLVTTFLTELLTRGARLQADASTGIVFTSLFAVGVLAVTLLTRNVHLGTEAVMGNADALQLSDCTFVYSVLGINLFFLFVFFNGLAITTFDPGLSRMFRISPSWYSYLLMTLVSLTSVSAYRAVGVLMLLAFVTGPALTARLVTKSLKGMLCLSVAIGILTSAVGVALTRDLLTRYGIALSTSGVVVSVIALTYCVTATAITCRNLLIGSMVQSKTSQ